jgi:hypothetical protein
LIELDGFGCVEPEAEQSRLDGPRGGPSDTLDLWEDPIFFQDSQNAMINIGFDAAALENQVSKRVIW